MRLTIRAEQMSAIEQSTQENFVRRIATHLLKEYPNAVVILPGDEKLTVDTLPQETLYELVQVAIARARRFKMTFESTIVAFTVMMFEAAPGFYKHTLCQVILNDDLEQEAQIDLLLSVLTEKTLKTIQERYDPNEWKPDETPDDSDQTEEKEQPSPVQKQPNYNDFAETVKRSK